MAEPRSRPAGSLNALIILGWNQLIWRKDMELPFAPFPGLGIRIDVYDMLNIESVVVGDFRYDVTCICSFEGGGEEYMEDRLRSFGFEKGDYPQKQYG